jgi:hypothetical protein
MLKNCPPKKIINCVRYKANKVPPDTFVLPVLCYVKKYVSKSFFGVALQIELGFVPCVLLASQVDCGGIRVRTKGDHT